MKKNFKVILATLCSIALLTACSSDGPESWEQLPKEEITTDSGDLTLTVNEQSVPAAKVSFTAISATEGTITITDAIPGYPSVPINVTMVEGKNKTFSFTGSTELMTAPSRAEIANSDKAFMTLNVSGTIDTNGKTIVNIAANGMAFYIGVYRNDSLALTYANLPNPGKIVTFTAINDVPVLILTGIIPGEFNAAIPGVYPDANGKISGTATTENGTNVEFAGQFNAGTGVLQLNVNPTLSTAAQGGIARTWNLSLEPICKDEYGEIPNEHSAIRMIWSPLTESAEKNGSLIANLVSSAGSHLVADLLSNITLNANGTLTAKYGDVDKLYIPDFSNIDMDNMETLGPVINWFFGLLSPEITVTQPSWTTSPANLAYWYTKDGLFYFVPDIAQIVAQVNANGDSDVSPETVMNVINQIAQMGNENPAGLIAYIQSLLETFIPGVDLSDVDPNTIKTIISWLQTGVPLKYSADGEYLSLYIDKEMADPFMKLIIKFIPLLQGKLDEVAAGNPMFSMIWMMTGIDSLNDIPEIWNNNTNEFLLSINFSQNAQANAPATTLHRHAKQPNYQFKNIDEAVNAIKTALQ